VIQRKEVNLCGDKFSSLHERSAWIYRDPQPTETPGSVNQMLGWKVVASPRGNTRCLLLELYGHASPIWWQEPTHVHADIGERANLSWASIMVPYYISQLVIGVNAAGRE
jgi:hypothetical protein